jgi:hypothetical protein
MGIGAAAIGGAVSLLIEMAAVVQRVGDATPVADAAAASAPTYFPDVAIMAFVAAFTWQLHRTRR